MQLQLQLSHPRLQRSCRRAALLELLTLPAVQQVGARQAQPLDHGWSRVTIQQHLHRLPLKLLGKRPATPPPRQTPALDWPLAHPPTPSWLSSLRSPAVRQIGSTSFGRLAAFLLLALLLSGLNVLEELGVLIDSTPLTFRSCGAAYKRVSPKLCRDQHL